MPSAPEISVVVPTRDGGELLASLVRAVRTQATARSVEIVLVDSGSPPGELERLAALGARVERISPCSFDHGLTWGPPIRIAELLAVGTHDPQAGTPVRDGSILAQIAVAPNGNLFVVWQDSRFNAGAFDSIVISSSR